MFDSLYIKRQTTEVRPAVQWHACEAIHDTSATLNRLVEALVGISMLALPSIALVTDLIPAASLFWSLLAVWCCIVAPGARRFVQAYTQNPAKGLTELHLSIGSRRKRCAAHCMQSDPSRIMTYPAGIHDQHTLLTARFGAAT
jgi:hypothetical protein